MSGSGGVVRNSNGDIIVGFARSYGMWTNNCTELHAVLNGISLCKAMRIENLVVECDTSLMVTWLINGSCTL